MSANPIDLVGGLASTANVIKADLTAWAKARVPQVMASSTEIRATVLANQSAVFLKTTGVPYFLDTTDTTTADDGVTCIISFDGFRFKILAVVVNTSSAQTLTNKTIDTATNTFKINGVAVATGAQFTAVMAAFVGDAGSGGSKGLVPAPAAGDAAAGKYLSAGGGFAVPPGVTQNASQAQMESASSNALASTPGIQKFHPAHPKEVAYLTVSGGTYSISTVSFGIASIAKIGTGVVEITISSAFSSTEFGVVAFAGAAGLIASEVIASRTTTKVRIDMRTGAGTNTDANVTVIFFGDKP